MPPKSAAKKPAVKPAPKTKSRERAVMVTTEFRGVFFGYATDTDGDMIYIKRARNCVLWDVTCKGFIGLAAHGPTKECRVGPATDIQLRGITAVLEVSPEAVKAWEAAPWR